jgi:murein DD-endopeptidase MepM/ murein hydrolase activator NlpD
MPKRTLAAGAGLLLLAGCTLSAAGLAEPMENAAHRAHPLHFGLHVTPDPATNPIQPPERFTGYHVAVDLEVGTDEVDKPVAVYAVCEGEVKYSGFAGGYGGVVVQACTLSGEDVTVIYGHLSLENLPGHGVVLKPRDQIAVLAEANSYASGGTRKHLHLGIHRGKEVDMRGYVQTEEEVREFIDPLEFLGEAPALPLQPHITPYWQAAG